MIVYQADKRRFREDVLSNRIEHIVLEAFRQKRRRGVSPAEIKAWKNSLGYIDRVLESDGIPETAGVAIEMGLPQSDKRMDFVLTGLNAGKRKVAVIIELKQWEEATITGKDGVVQSFVGGAVREISHPSYQAWSYAALLEDFNEAVRDVPIELRPCAYLHNCNSVAAIRSKFYREHTDRAPAFLRDDALLLREFIQQHVRFGDRGEVLYEIVNGRIRPSKNLADKLASLLAGNREFVLIDEQKLVFETGVALAVKAVKGAKQTLIVAGGPGTGKSVVAINLLVELIKRNLNVQYVTRNAAPRAVYEAKLAGTMKKTRISNLFRGSGGFHRATADSFDVLVVDEAHRLNEKSGLYRNEGENQIKELIEAARLTIFFVDDAQKVTLSDIGSVDSIREWASTLGSEATEAELASQFRCGGSDGYLAWVDHTLGIRTTANPTLDGINYEVRVCESATELRNLVRSKNASGSRARMVAGYCWPWKSKKNSDLDDIEIPAEGFSAQWNLTDDGSLWILKDHTVEQVGCIHTCQGLEVDYVGVILGPDLVIRDGEWVEFPNKRDRHDRSIRGYQKLLLMDSAMAQRKVREVIRNTYRTLMTRGARGCFLFSVDQETNEFLRRAAARELAPQEVTIPTEDAEIPFVELPYAEAKPFANCVPCFPDVRVAAGAFAEQLSTSNCRWIRLPEPFAARPGYFVVKVVGESMNRRIPNGSWCVFRATPEGSRNGKVVLVQHRDVQDPDTGSCTVKTYQSTKAVREDGWEHQTITLVPDSTDPRFKKLDLSASEQTEFRVIGEFVAVISTS